MGLILVFLFCSGGQFCGQNLISWPKKEIENFESDLRIVTNPGRVSRKALRTVPLLEVKAQLYSFLKQMTVH